MPWLTSANFLKSNMNAKSTCALCLTRTELVNSHLIPAALYRQIREPQQLNPNPVLISKSGARLTSDQVKARLLCSDCENLLSREGEDYVLPRCARKDGGFKLRDDILKGTLIEQSPRYKGYEIGSTLRQGITKLLHFGSGVFWKSSVGKWKDRGRMVKSIDLGPYEEEFRRYLHGQAPFPLQSRMMLQVSDSPNPDLVITFPHRTKLRGMFRYKFQIPGLQFVLFVGGKIPHEKFTLASSTCQSVFLCDLHDDGAFRGMLDLVRQAGKLKPARRKRK